jgi:hypothetical protein
VHLIQYQRERSGTKGVSKLFNLWEEQQQQQKKAKKGSDERERDREKERIKINALYLPVTAYDDNSGLKSKFRSQLSPRKCRFARCVVKSFELWRANVEVEAV